MRQSDYLWCESQNCFVDWTLCNHVKGKCEDCKCRRDPPVKTVQRD